MLGRLAIGVALAWGIWGLVTHPETRVFAKMDNQTANLHDKTGTNPSFEQKPRIEPLTASIDKTTVVEPVQNTKNDSLATAENQKPTEVVVKNSSLDAPTIVWQYFTSRGFSREQTAGIMGNLRQEHNFQTSDVAGGLGVAQWLGNRRAALQAKPDYLNLTVQLDFIVEELNGVESRAGAALKAATTVEAATIAFQDLYERCGQCMQSQRVAYAYEYLGRY